MADGFAYSLNTNQPVSVPTTMLSSSGDLVVATAAGGNGTLTSLNVTANTQIGTPNNSGTLPSLPAGAFIDSIALRETTGNGAVTVNIGSTLTGTDIVSGQAVSSGAGAFVASPSKSSYAAGGLNAAQAIYVNASSFGRSQISVVINYIIPGI